MRRVCPLEEYPLRQFEGSHSPGIGGDGCVDQLELEMRIKGKVDENRALQVLDTEVLLKVLT